MKGTDAAPFARHDFGIRRNETSQNQGVFVIDLFGVVDAEITVAIFLHHGAGRIFTVVSFVHFLYLI